MKYNYSVFCFKKSYKNTNLMIMPRIMHYGKY